MMIRKATTSVCYPLLGQRTNGIRGSWRIRYVRGSPLVNRKGQGTDK
jgi:hypothetical protein